MKITPLSKKMKMTKPRQEVPGKTRKTTKKLTTKTLIDLRKNQPQQETIVLNKEPNRAILNRAGSSIEIDVLIGVDAGDWFCSICEKNIVEDMVQCLICQKWVHESCVGPKNKIKKYVCFKCCS